MDRHKNEVVFVKCNNSSCCKEFRSNDFKEFLQKSSMKLRAPTPSTDKSGHYKTFLEECVNENPQFGDYGQPTSAEKELGACERCPGYKFMSTTEKQRHYSLFHRRQTGPISNEKIFECQFNNCNQHFGSASALNRHKIYAMHTARQNRLVDEPPEKKKSEVKIRNNAAT